MQHVAEEVVATYPLGVIVDRAKDLRVDAAIVVAPAEV
jgi:hypothetical protein